MLSFCWRWKSGSFTGLRGKRSKNPHTGDCGVARWFIQVETCPWISSFSSPSIPPWKKSNRVLSKAKTKARVQSFCFTLKLRSSEPTPSAVGTSSCWIHMATCSWARENAHTWGAWGECITEREGGREGIRGRGLGGSLFPWAYFS